MLHTCCYMKRILLFTLGAIITAFLPLYGQTSKYDGDWYNKYNGVCGMEYQDDNENTPIKKGVGNRVFRIQTEDGETTVQAKEQYPCASDFEYREVVVSRCDEDALEFHCEVLNFYSEYYAATHITTYYYTVTKVHGTLYVSGYSSIIRKDRSGNNTHSERMSLDGFTMHKNGNDW